MMRLRRSSNGMDWARNDTCSHTGPEKDLILGPTSGSFSAGETLNKLGEAYAVS
jgi:hypothetical protein